MNRIGSREIKPRAAPAGVAAWHALPVADVEARLGTSPRGLDRDEVEVRVTIGVQQPDKVDGAAGGKNLPLGRNRGNAAKGG